MAWPTYLLQILTKCESTRKNAILSFLGWEFNIENVGLRKFMYENLSQQFSVVRGIRTPCKKKVLDESGFKKDLLLTGIRT